MPDITMCSGEGCERRGECYRFMAKPSEFMQAYFAKPPLEDGDCLYFWSAKVEASKKRGKAK
jgi:hypothetical protein